MASIVKRGKKKYAVVYYEGEGKNRHQVWESGLSYSTAKARKAQLEFEFSQQTHIARNEMTVADFLREFLSKYGERKWVASTYQGNVAMLENYVFPYLGDKKLRDVRVKTADDYYYFLEHDAMPAANMGQPRRKHVTTSVIRDVHKLLRCAWNLAVKWEYVGKNPFLHATPPEHKEKKRKSLTPSQLQRVLEFTDRPDIYDYFVMHCAIQLAFACCMRGGEVGGAQWDRYDSGSGILFVDRVIDRVDKKLVEKLPKMEVYFSFPNLYPGARTMIVLKQPKTEGSVRNVYLPRTVAYKLEKLRQIQDRFHIDLGDDGYMDYGLIICQANGRPCMTEHLNHWFKDILEAMNDPELDPNEYVFHSIRHTSAEMKLRLSKGDIKTVQGDGGWNTPDMVTKRYTDILDENRQTLAAEMEQKFYQTELQTKAGKPPLDAGALAAMLKENPELLRQVLQSVQVSFLSG